MKNLKKVICSLLVIVFTLSNNNVKIFAEKVEYTDNVIPKMTSNTSPSGTAKADTEYNYANYYHPAYLAFDHDSSSSTSAWSSARGTNTGILEYDFSIPRCITKYTLEPRNFSDYYVESPKDWTFEAWNDSINQWVILDTQTNITNWVIGKKNEFTFSNNTFYSKYRINISSPCGKPGLVVIGELEMMETKSVAEGNKAILEIVMTSGIIKEYDLTADELEKFLTWYDNRSEGIGKSYFKIPKRSNVKPYISRYEYLSYDKIYSFEVKEYNE